MLSFSQLCPRLLPLLLPLQVTFGSSTRVHLKTAGDLIQFSSNVSSGTTFKGTTVFLDTDIDFSGGLSLQFKPIGSFTTGGNF